MPHSLRNLGLILALLVVAACKKDGTQSQSSADSAIATGSERTWVKEFDTVFIDRRDSSKSFSIHSDSSRTISVDVAAKIDSSKMLSVTRIDTTRDTIRSHTFRIFDAVQHIRLTINDTVVSDFEFAPTERAFREGVPEVNEWYLSMPFVVDKIRYDHHGSNIVIASEGLRRYFVLDRSGHILYTGPNPRAFRMSDRPIVLELDTAKGIVFGNVEARDLRRQKTTAYSDLIPGAKPDMLLQRRFLVNDLWMLDLVGQKGLRANNSPEPMRVVLVSKELAPLATLEVELGSDDSVTTIKDFADPTKSVAVVGEIERFTFFDLQPPYQVKSIDAKTLKHPKTIPDESDEIIRVGRGCIVEALYRNRGTGTFFLSQSARCGED
jgi:hypothetical protein